MSNGLSGGTLPARVLREPVGQHPHDGHGDLGPLTEHALELAVAETNRPPRWRVTQTLVLEGGDFAALSGLVSKLQGSDGLVLSGLNFTVSTATRRAAEDALTQQAIRNWQQRAQSAAQGFGAGGWRPGRITVQTNDYARPPPMFRTAGVAAASAAPVAVEGGMSDVTVTVSGEAILDTGRAPR